MKPVLALIGRPNVGKSTLFNRLTRSRDALVADFPGLTRDRKYGMGELNGRGYHLIDTGGLSGEEAGIDEYMAKQTRAAIGEADALIFIVDGKQGLTAADEMIAADLRQTGKPVFLLVNKTDRVDPDQAAAEFYGLGFTQVFMIAAAHGRGVTSTFEAILDYLNVDYADEEELADDDSIRIAFVAKTFDDAKAAFKGARCPEQNNKAFAIIDNNGGACFRCGLCPSGRNNVLFSASKK